MKKIIILALMILSSVSVFAQLTEIPTQEIPADYGYKVKIGDSIPEIVLQLANGQTVTTDDLKGKVVMLQFTASWCGVCREEMPYIEKDIWQKNKDRSDFALIGVDMDEPLETVNEFSKDVGITYPLALDPGAEIFYTFAEEGAGVTRNVIIDREGKIVFMTRLFNEEEFYQMLEVIDLLLQSS